MDDTPAAPSADDKAFKHWFSRAVVDGFARAIAAVPHPDAKRFDRRRFLRHLAPLETLALKARVQLIAEALHAALPLPFPEAMALFIRTLPPPFDPATPNGQHILAWPLTTFVARYGLGHFDASLAALHALTQRFTAEFDVRPFLLAEPARTLATLQRWTRDPSEHVRRLVSEGTRTRLPWGLRLQPFIDDPTPLVPLIEALHADPSPYVRRSVANHLNDLSKDHPDLVIALVRRFGAAEPNGTQLAARALRTLVKAGHHDALEVMGVAGHVDTVYFAAPARASIGGALALTATLENRGATDQKVVVDVAVAFQGARGLKAPKVFKWKTLVVPAGARVTLDKALPLVQTSVRTIRPGHHEVFLQVNGRHVARADVDLMMPK